MCRRSSPLVCRVGKTAKTYGILLFDGIAVSCAVNESRARSGGVRWFGRAMFVYSRQSYGHRWSNDEQGRNLLQIDSAQVNETIVLCPQLRILVYWQLVPNSFVQTSRDHGGATWLAAVQLHLVSRLSARARQGASPPKHALGYARQGSTGSQVASLPWLFLASTVLWHSWSSLQLCRLHEARSLSPQQLMWLTGRW